MTANENKTRTPTTNGDRELVELAVADDDPLDEEDGVELRGPVEVGLIDEEDDCDTDAPIDWLEVGVRDDD